MSGNTLPVSYGKLGAMVQKGDTIFLGRYLVTGSEESSCYLTVRAATHALQATSLRARLWSPSGLVTCPSLKGINDAQMGLDGSF